MTLLQDDQIRTRLESLDGWERDGGAIRSRFEFETFAGSIAFVNRVAAQAEAADHHPEILIDYTAVTLTLSTHSEGGITAKDLDLAQALGRPSTTLGERPPN